MVHLNKRNASDILDEAGCSILRAARGLSAARGSAEAAALAFAVFIPRFINVQAKTMTIERARNGHAALPVVLAAHAVVVGIP